MVLLLFLLEKHVFLLNSFLLHFQQNSLISNSLVSNSQISHETPPEIAADRRDSLGFADSGDFSKIPFVCQFPPFEDK